MNKRYFVLLLISIFYLKCFAIKVGDLYYNINNSNYTASVTYEEYYELGGRNYAGLTTITVPATIQYNGKIYEVSKIDSYAFLGCPDLETIDIGENITSFSDRAFENSPKLKKVIWRAKKCGSWGIYVHPFSKNIPSQIKTIIFSDNVQTIPPRLCNAMTNLDTIGFGKNIVSIEEGNIQYFKNVYITDLSMYCKINITDYFPAGFKLFLNNEEINQLVIPKDITMIQDNNFKGCSSIHSLQLTKNITTIEKDAFKNCTNLSTVTFAAASCEDLENTIFDNNSIKNITFSENVKHIPSHICNNQPIQSITIPSNVETIGANAFFGCSQISHIYWNAINCSVIDNGVFNSSSSNITSFIFGNGVEEIPHHICYNMNKLTSVTIPYGVIRINNNAFQWCSNLTAITIPNSVTTLGESAFYGCTAWRVVFPNSLKYIGENAIYNTFTYNSERSWTDNVLYVENYLIKCKKTNNVSSYSIKEGTVVIADAAFTDITNLSSIYIPNTVTHIGARAFNNCKNISSINIPNKVESIGESAMRVYFKQGTHIKESLQLPHTLTHLGDYAFMTWDISSIYAKMPTPPAITEWTFGLTNSMANTPVYVYHENINSYYQANVWKQFDIISAYKVVFTDENGAIIEEQMVGHGENATPPQMPNQEGYQFVGWDKSYTNITNDIVIKAIYKPAKYKVIFYDYDYTVLKSDSVLYGNNAIPPKDPIRHGYIFIGWDKDYSNVKSDLNIIAQYEQDIIYYTVTFLDWDGTELHIEKVEEGKDAQGPPTEPKRDGYKFIGWSKPITNITTNLTVIALYDEASAVDEVEAQGTAIRKLIEDHQLRIVLPDGDKYNAMGQKL